MGNLLLKDEGIGVHLVRYLEGKTFQGDREVEIIDAGTLPDIPVSLSNTTKLIIVDAVQGGEPPGSIYRFRPEDVPAARYVFTSPHQINLLDNLQLTQVFDSVRPEVVIIGIEPEDVSPGLELSPVLARCLPGLAKVVTDEIENKRSTTITGGAKK
jgi:hydrogenase maturation protease